MHRAHILPADMGVHHLWKKDWFQNRKGCNMATPTVKECDISRAPRRSHCVTVTFSAKVCARILAPSAPNWLTAWRWEWKSCLEFRPQNSWLKSLTKVWKGENSGRWLFFCLLGWSGKSSWFPPPPNEVFGFVTWRADFWLKHNNLYFSSSIPEIRSSHILWPKNVILAVWESVHHANLSFSLTFALEFWPAHPRGLNIWRSYYVDEFWS